MREHAIGTAEAFSAMKPEYIGLLDVDGGAGYAAGEMGASRAALPFWARRISCGRRSCCSSTSTARAAFSG